MNREVIMKRLREAGIFNARFVTRTFSVDQTCIQLLEYNPLRCYFYIQNNSSVNLYVNYDAEINATNAPKTAQIIGAGNFYEPYVCPTNSIYVVSASATKVPGIALIAILED